MFAVVRIIVLIACAYAGSAVACEAMGDKKKATEYYAKLLEL